MSDVGARRAEDAADRPATASPPTLSRVRGRRVWLRRLGRFVAVLVTLGLAAAAAAAGWWLWQIYMATPWTRDGAVRAYVVTIAPEVAGRVIQLRVGDNQLVHKGDPLMKIDPSEYAIAVNLAQAAVDQAKADLENKRVLAARRQQLSDLAVTPEEKQTYVANARVAQAVYEQQVAALARAKLNLERTDIRAPVNGWITNLQFREGDFAGAGQPVLSVVDSDSFWVDGYFEETLLASVREGDRARVRLLGRPEILAGHVDSIARGIVVGNAQPGQGGLANVNPIFTWVRLAQRVPVRIRLDAVPPGVRLIAGLTASIEIEPGTTGSGEPAASQPRPAADGRSSVRIP